MSFEMPLKFRNESGNEVCYNYCICDDIWNNAPQILGNVSFDRLMALTDQGIDRIYGEQIARLLGTTGRGSRLVLPEGEQMKTLACLESVTESMLERRISKQSLLLCIGGGCIGNLGTVVAATYFRGIRHIHVPTTLMAMADSAISHKGAINVRNSKNALGTYHAPLCILTDVGFLSSLTEREIRNGLAEIIKHGVIEENDLLTELQTAVPRAGVAPNSLKKVIRHTIESRMRISANDVEEAGRGALLQLGHAIGHAIELLVPSLLHGEAVAIGMVAEARIGVAMGFPLDRRLPDKLGEVLSRYGLPTELPNMVRPDNILRQLLAGKHNRSGQVCFALIRDIGRPYREGGAYWHPVDSNCLYAFLGKQCGHHSSTTRRSVAYHRPALGAPEALAAAAVISSGMVSPGSEQKHFERELTEHYGTPALVTCNGTAALVTALSALRIGPGDDVILPGYGFVAVLSATLNTGARPVFVDIAEENLGMDPALLEERITPATKVVICQHMHGQIAAIAAIAAICRRHHLWLIEDCAQAMGGMVGHRKLGTFGHLAVLSFAGTKNITTGEGGALLTKHCQVYERANLIRDHGMVARDESILPGLNFQMSDVNAAIGRVQLRKLDDIVAAKRRLSEAYVRTLAGSQAVVAFVPRTSDMKPAYNVFPLRLIDPQRTLEEVQERFQSVGIAVKIRYNVPLYRQQVVGKQHTSECSFPHTERAVSSVFGLPCYPGLTEEDVERLLEAVRQILL